MTRPAALIALSLALTLSGCALALRNPSIADLRHDPLRYHHRTVTIDGIVTSSWGVPLVPFRIYRVTDGTGEVTVVSPGGRIPPRGSRVQVRGRVGELAVLGGQPVGLHLQQQRLKVRRR